VHVSEKARKIAAMIAMMTKTEEELTILT